MAKDAEIFVLTVYKDSGGMIDFHAGPEGDFEEDIAKNHDVYILRSFTISGHILSETIP